MEFILILIPVFLLCHPKVLEELVGKDGYCYYILTSCEYLFTLIYNRGLTTGQRNKSKFIRRKLLVYDLSNFKI